MNMADWLNKNEPIERIICDYNKNTIKDVWNSKFYKDLRNQHLCNNYGNNQFCKKCPDWANTSWPLEKNKSYADLVEKILYNE